MSSSFVRKIQSFKSYRAAGLLVCTLALTSGCVLASPGPTPVSQGLLFQTQNQRYDRFFNILHSHQVALAEAQNRPKEIRAGLAEYLELDEDVSLSFVARKLEDEVKRYAQGGNGFSFQLELDESPPSLEAALKGPPNRSAENFLKSMESTARGALRLSAEMKKIEEELDELKADLPELVAAINDNFSGESPGRRADIRKNFEDAEKLFPVMVEVSTEVSSDALAIASRIARVMNSKVAPAEPGSGEGTTPPSTGSNSGGVEVVPEGSSGGIEIVPDTPPKQPPASSEIEIVE